PLAALRPVAAGAVIAGCERGAVGLRAGQDVVHVGCVATAVDQLPLLGQRRLLVMLLLALFSSVRFLAMTVPLAFCQGPDPTRSRALTAPAPCVLRYACQVLPSAPAACARI